MVDIDDIIAKAKAAGVPVEIKVEMPQITDSEFVRFYKQQCADWHRREYELLMIIDRMERRAMGEPMTPDDFRPLPFAIGPGHGGE